MPSSAKLVHRLCVGSIVRLCAGLIVVATALAISGCGKGGVTGTYVAQGKDTDNSGMKFVLELKDGGVAVITITGPNGQSMPSVTGTYTVNGDKITTVLDNDMDEMTLKDGTLTMKFMDETLVLRKQ